MFEKKTIRKTDRHILAAILFDHVCQLHEVCGPAFKTFRFQFGHCRDDVELTSEQEEDLDID